jgi:hypothetical protein
MSWKMNKRGWLHNPEKAKHTGEYYLPSFLIIAKRFSIEINGCAIGGSNKSDRLRFLCIKHQQLEVKKIQTL